MAEELKDDGNWVPVTPAKAVKGHSGVDSGKEKNNCDRMFGNLSAGDACFANVSGNSGCNVSLGLDGGLSDKVEYEETGKVEVSPSWIRGIQLKNEQERQKFGSDSSTAKASNTQSHPNSQSSSYGVSLNNKKRPKMKKHRPKVFDETKPRKTPKSQTVHPLTPKQKTPKRYIPRTSPLEKWKCMRKENPREAFDGNLGSATNSCRRLDFNLENHVREQHGYDNNGGIDGMTDAKVMETSFKIDEHVQMVDGFQPPKNSSCGHGHEVDQTSYCAVKGLTVSPNAYSESSLKANSLEGTLKLDVNFNLEMQDFDSCPGIRAIIQQYQCRKTSRSNTLHKEDLNFDEKIMTPKEGSTTQYGGRFCGLKVYKRKFRPNECLKNSRKLGPNFPRIYKKKRMKRQRATIFHSVLCMKKMDACVRHKMTSKRRSTYHRTVKKIPKRDLSMKLGDLTRHKRVMDNEMSSNFAMIEYNLRVIQPSRSQIMEAMADPKSFNCVWNLHPLTNFRKKRSQTLGGKKKCWGMHEEMKHPKPQEAFLLKALSVGAQHAVQENCEDLVEIMVEHIPYLDAYSLIGTPILAGQHLDLKHMFSNLNADEVQGMTDVISQMFEKLCISDDNNQLVVWDQKVSGALLPYEGKFEPSKRRKLLPKVDLDAETLRVWKLLMENDGSEDNEEVENDRKKKWDSDREIFRRRIDSFISCMHSIQGDRRFSPWKGSVVDSVVGVFLTQNVSDHLSSSAFMSLAAKFPPSVTKQSNTDKSNVSHQESVDINEVDYGQSTDGNNEHPNLCSTERETKQCCICAITQILRGDERSYKDALQGIPDSSSCKSSTNISQPCTCENSAIISEVLHGEENASHQQINHQEENKISCNQSIVDTKFGDAGPDSISCESSDTIPKPCTSENLSMLWEKVFKEENNASLQQFHDYEEIKMSCDQRMGDTEFGGAVLSIPYSSSHKNSTTMSKPWTNENSAKLREENALLQQFYNHEENKSSCYRGTRHAEFGDAAPGIPDSSDHNRSTTISRPCTSENSSIFREDLLVEEDKFLQQFHTHEDNMTSCDKSIGILKFGASQSNACALRSDKTSDLDGTAVSCLTKSQHLMADLGNINIKYLSDIGKNNESAGGRKKRQVKEKQESPVNWDELRKKYCCGKSKDSMNDNIDSANWEAVRQASVEEVAKVIMDRGMNNILAGRIKDFLDRMIEDHETIDLEWLRDVPPDKAKDYLLSIPGLGLKSTECVRLLTLRHHAFPVDTNVGRILVRLGWVPLLPLPEDLQLHLLNQYPLVDTIQKYIWPYLCKISKETLYECHYQMITFGKVFCTKRRPNCNACPMRGQCRHFASAYASAKLRLPGVQGESNEYQSQVKSSQNLMDTNPPALVYRDDDFSRVGHICFNSEAIVEFPPSPEPASREIPERDIEDFGYESEDEIPTIKLNQDEFAKNLLYFMEKTNFLNGEGAMSNELVTLSPEAASIPIPKLKFVGRLRTVHQVYEVPDSHPLVAGFEKRDPDDPCPYLLAIWTNDETTNSSQLPKGSCGCQTTCDLGTCCLEDAFQKQNDELVQGTMLIPCRTANRGSFPLNGTYFQVNEVFADHESSRQPIPVPRKWIWNLRRRSLYCGTSTTSIFRGMTTDEIQYCFWRGFICVRATDRVTRAPKPLARRFHICKTRQVGDE